MSEEIHSTQGIIPIRYFPVPLAQAGSLPSLIVNAGVALHWKRRIWNCHRFPALVS